jgi:hypothetical protein
MSVVDIANQILCYKTDNCSFITMSESTKRSHDGDSDDSSDGWVGPMPSEAAKPKKCKCKSLH